MNTTQQTTMEIDQPKERNKKKKQFLKKVLNYSKIEVKFGARNFEVLVFNPQRHPQGGEVWTILRKQCVVRNSELPDLFGVGYSPSLNVFERSVVGLSREENVGGPYRDRAMKHGKTHEAACISNFWTHMCKLKNDTTFKELAKSSPELKPAGLYVMNITDNLGLDPLKKFSLGVTPDVLIYSTNTNKVIGVMEGKCPFNRAAAQNPWPKINWLIQLVMEMVVTGVEYGWVSAYFPASIDQGSAINIWEVYLSRDDSLFMDIYIFLCVFFEYCKLINKNGDKIAEYSQQFNTNTAIMKMNILKKLGHHSYIKVEPGDVTRGVQIIGEKGRLKTIKHMNLQ